MEERGVNALYGPFLISTIFRHPGYKNNGTCVNALYGPFLISTEVTDQTIEYDLNVSMPYTGLF